MPKLKKFSDFADSLFPSEVEYIKKNNSYADREILSILDRIERRISFPEDRVEFDTKIDQRKYSKLITSITRKLQERDVDFYFAWISEMNSKITVDSITSKEQKRIFREIKEFEIGWFHMDSFFQLAENYEGYLLRRFRQADFKLVRSFLENHRSAVHNNRRVERQIKEITASIVLNSTELEKSKATWLLNSFRNEQLSKKNRFHALVAFLMYHVGKRNWDTLIEPIEELEKELFDGDFYSRRILANLYANKLIAYNSKGDFEKAAYFGRQSIKHKTEDFLYYLNNLVTVLIHLKRENDALELMQVAFSEYKENLDLGRRVVFISNYARCLNRLDEFSKAVRVSNRFLRENRQKIFQFKWHYFFRIYFYSLLKIGNSEQIVKLSRNLKLVDREKSAGFNPHIKALVLAAEYQEIRVSQKEYSDSLNALEGQNLDDKDFTYLMENIREDLPLID